MAKRKPKLEKKDRPRPAYVMPPPNDDAEAYNWELKSLRHPNPESDNKRDPEPGQSIFRAPQENYQTMRRYGHDAQFVCPKYLQIILDCDPKVRAATEAAAAARYTQEAIQNLQVAILKSFRDVVLTDIAKNLEKIAPIIAQFYAARLAHIKKFGTE